ncbi:hypothetical protein RclHR1_01350020 [Rhizophagus clarus]|uniref:Uncharacterized protein n=1 Tax=Rhizophagus clarus TaxID=94130 RepID=A0A2Z6QC09_9GLOM|nr:hypothetical protein RclHR1_01350020 [Rhizophagus clarus]GES98963.1 hypothetical protein RCL_jg997.t1 [Rhizophagus clarus]
MEETLRSSSQEPGFAGPWITKDEMVTKRIKPSLNTSHKLCTGILKANEIKITDQELTAFGISQEEWTNLVKEKEDTEEAPNITIVFQEINDKCTSRKLFSKRWTK